MPTAAAPNPEATAAAVIQKNESTTVRGPHAAVIEGVRKIQKEKSGEAALQSMQNKPHPVDEKRIVDSIDKHIQGSGDVVDKKDPVTGVVIGKEHQKTANETKFSKDAADATAQINKYLKGELKFANPTIPTTEEKEVIKVVAEAIRDADPVFATALSAFTAGSTEYNGHIIAILKDPQLGGHVRTLLEQATDPQKAISTEMLATLRTAFHEKKLAEEKRKLEIDLKRKDLERADVVAARHAPPPAGSPPGTKGGDLYEKWKDLNDKHDKTVQDNTDAKDKFDKLERKIEDLRRQKGEAGKLKDKVRADETMERLQGEIDRLTPGRNLAEDTYKKTSLDLTQEETLATNRASAQAEQQRIALDLGHAELDFKEMQRATSIAQVTRDQAQGNIEKAQQDYVNSLKNVFAEAAQKYAQEEFVKKDALNKQHLETTRDEATNKAEKIIADGLLTRWDNTTGKGREKYDMKGIEREYKDLLTRRTADGPKPLLKAMLIRGGLSATEADTWLANKEFVDKMAPQVVEQLLLRRLQTNGITANEAEVIVQTPWGEEAINKAIAKQDKIAATIAELEKSGKLKKEGFMDALKKMDGKKKAMWLAIIFGGLVGVAASAAHSAGLI